MGNINNNALYGAKSLTNTFHKRPAKTAKISGRTSLENVPDNLMTEIAYISGLKGTSSLLVAYEHFRKIIAEQRYLLYKKYLHNTPPAGMTPEELIKDLQFTDHDKDNLYKAKLESKICASLIRAMNCDNELILKLDNNDIYFIINKLRAAYGNSDIPNINLFAKILCKCDKFALRHIAKFTAVEGISTDEGRTHFWQKVAYIAPHIPVKEAFKLYEKAKKETFEEQAIIFILIKQKSVSEQIHKGFRLSNYKDFKEMNGGDLEKVGHILDDAEQRGIIKSSGDKRKFLPLDLSKIKN
ncbi:MAG: hypothetical protein AAF621_06240 [Pseudomonadota bacterium]